MLSNDQLHASPADPPTAAPRAVVAPGTKSCLSLPYSSLGAAGKKTGGATFALGNRTEKGKKGEEGLLVEQRGHVSGPGGLEAGSPRAPPAQSLPVSVGLSVAGRLRRAPPTPLSG